MDTQLPGVPDLSEHNALLLAELRELYSCPDCISTTVLRWTGDDGPFHLTINHGSASCPTGQRQAESAQRGGES